MEGEEGRVTLVGSEAKFEEGALKFLKHTLSVYFRPYKALLSLHTSVLSEDSKPRGYTIKTSTSRVPLRNAMLTSS